MYPAVSNLSYKHGNPISPIAGTSGKRLSNYYQQLQPRLVEQAVPPAGSPLLYQQQPQQPLPHRARLRAAASNKSHSHRSSVVLVPAATAPARSRVTSALHATPSKLTGPAPFWGCSTHGPGGTEDGHLRARSQGKHRGAEREAKIRLHGARRHLSLIHI